MPQYKLTYFNIRGLCEPIRFIFAYAGVEYEDVRIDPDEWQAVKPNYAWGVLPQIEIDGKVLSQSTAICRYLAKQYNLTGADDFEAAKCDEYADAAKDIGYAVQPYFMEKDEAKKEEIKKQIATEGIPKFLKKFNADLEASGGKFLVGNQYTWVDLLVAHFNFQTDSFFGSEILNDYPFIRTHMEGVFNIPQIKAWVEKRPKTMY